MGEPAVYTDAELEEIVAILASVTPVSGLPVSVAHRADFSESFQLELEKSGLTTAGYFADQIVTAAQHALAAYNEIEGKKARAQRRKAGRLAHQLKALIENPVVLQNYVIAAGLGRTLDNEDIINILAALEKASYFQVNFNSFPPNPCDYFTLRRYLGRQILDVYRLLTGKVGPFSLGESDEPHGSLIDLIVCGVNPINRRIGRTTLSRHSAAELVRAVRTDMRKWLDRP